MNNTPWSNRPVNRVLFATLLLAFLLSTSAASAQDTESRQIAVIVSSVGSDAQRDRLAYQAAVLAAEQLRDSSDGIEASDGTRYTLDIRQYTATSADDAADAVDEALDDGADLIIAPLNASFRDTVIDNAEGVTVLYYAEDDTAPTVALKLAPALRTQIVAAADYLTTIRAFTDIAVVNADTTAADAGADSFATEIGADALAVRLTHEADQTDFASDARSIRDAGAQAAFVYTLEAPASSSPSTRRATPTACTRRSSGRQPPMTPPRVSSSATTSPVGTKTPPMSPPPTSTRFTWPRKPCVTPRRSPAPP